MDFIEALEFLASKAGIDLQHDQQSGAVRQQRKQFLDAMEQAVSWYHQRLLESPDAGPARTYLRSRGYDGETVRKFKLGWAPDDWDALTRALDLSPKLLEGTGLGFVNKRGKRQDALRARIIFPIFDSAGHAIAVGGRILPPGPDGEARPEAKYKNSPETPIYSKRRTLYALNWAKDDVVKSGEIVVCEGYTDVIAFFEAGVPRAVATCGTALSEDHFRTMRNFAQRIVLAYDGDSAGQNAAASVYQGEQQFDAEVAVAQFPKGMDPAELAQKDPEALRQALQNAEPFLQFRLRRVLDAGNYTTAESRARVAQAAVAVIAEHPSDLVRDQYLQQVADKCRVDVDALRPKVATARRQGPPPDDAPTPTTVPHPDLMAYKPGVEALRRVIHDPDSVAGRLAPSMFADGVQRTAFEMLATGELVVHVIDALQRRGDEWAATLVSILAVEGTNVSESPEVDQVIVDGLVAQLLRSASHEALQRVQRDIRDGSITAESGLQAIRDVRQRLDLLGTPQQASVEEELRGWLEALEVGE
jgi:DNA primase